MKLEEFLEAVKKHGEWLLDSSKGLRLEFHGKLEIEAGATADLSSANLIWADLSWANLSSADLSSADLISANLISANLSWANLRSANLSSADLDFSSGLNLSCKNLNFKADVKLAAQLAYHFCRIDFGDSKEAKEAQNALINLANTSHLLTYHELPKIEVKQ